MFTKQKLSVLASAVAAMTMSGVVGAAGSATGTLTVNATMTSACTVSASPTISFVFGAQDATAIANSASTFQVACSSDLTPTIYASGTRSMINGSNTMPFNLSLTSGAALNDLPTVSPGAALSLIQDGTLKDVPLYASVAASTFKGLQGGSYSVTGISVVVSY
jgi:spore coat protein U-like protein